LRSPDVRYGPHARERLDIFPAGEAQAPTLVFFHGGYWQAMDKEVFHFIAAGFRKYGVTTIHFSILEHLTQEKAALNQAIRAQMGITQ
jgi:hypothetical protein